MAADPRTSRERILRQAFDDTLNLFGEHCKRTILVDLECSGVYSSDKTYLSLEEIARELARFFGEGAAELIMEHVIIGMDKLQQELAETNKSRKL